MYDQYTEALEQYEMQVHAVRKGRGAWICETDRGIRLLKEYRGTAKRLEFEDEVLSCLDLEGVLRADRYVRNREGSLLSVSGDGTRYVLKEWFDEPECDLKDARQVRLAVSRLATLHQMLRAVSIKEEWDMGSIRAESLREEFARHNREMKKARAFIRTKRVKTEFELSVMGSFDRFFEQAQQASRGLSKLLGREDALKTALCHGSIDQHHLLMGDDYTAIIEYNQLHLGLQAEDLYRLMRKVMERQGWDVWLGKMMMEAYEAVRPMEAVERESLYYMFLYPEKYWKQLNFYYNTNKAWISARNIEKLKVLEEQQSAREQFLEKTFRA